MTRADDELEAGELPTDRVNVRVLKQEDLDDIVRIDASLMGRSRADFYRDKVAFALDNSRLCVSLVADLDGMTLGFLMATLHYGEFGHVEPTAVLEAIGVHRDFRGHQVGAALMRSFLMNTRALNVARVRTEVAWNDHELLRFLANEGFSPAPRLVLERSLDEP